MLSAENNLVGMLASYLKLPKYDTLTLIAINAGKLDTRAISKFVDVPRTKLYSILKNLESMDFIEQSDYNYKLVSDFDDRIKKLLQDSVNNYIDFVDKIKRKYDFELSLYIKVLEEVRSGTVKCFGCGKRTLKLDQLKMYDHEDGIAIPNEKQNQWVSFECKCGYNTSWSKILNAKQVRKSMLRQSYKTHKSVRVQKNRS